MKRYLRSILQAVGYDLIRFNPPTSHPLGRRKQLLRSYQIDVLFDIGANIGQYAADMRRLGFRGKIISFEPLKSAFEKLSLAARGNPNWEVLNYALGEAPGKMEINVAANLESSSLHDMLPKHLNAAPESVYIGTEMIEIRTLDSIFTQYCSPGSKVYMKIDTQGHEMQVLEGAAQILDQVHVIQMELSTQSLYAGAPLFPEMISYLDKKGFTLVSVEPGFSDVKTGELLQMDGIFRRA